MKVISKPKYFEMIKTGKRDIDYRSAHFTFVNEETGEKLTREVIGVGIIPKKELPKELKKETVLFGDKDDEMILWFKVK